MEPFPHHTHKFNYALWRQDLQALEVESAWLKDLCRKNSNYYKTRWALIKCKARINTLLEVRAWVRGKQRAKNGTNSWVWLWNPGFNFSRPNDHKLASLRSPYSDLNAMRHVTRHLSATCLQDWMLGDPDTYRKYLILKESQCTP